MAIDVERPRGGAVKEPQEALEAARRAASGADEEPGGAAWTLEDPTLSTRRLVEWAILSPDEAKVYSTRRYGRPVTLFKRMLVRMLRQYLNEVSAQQSRFNAAVAAHVMRLEQRVEELERRREAAGGEFERPREAAGGEPPPR
jgi:hypothetical protein